MKKFVFSLETILQLRKNEKEEKLFAFSQLQERKTHLKKNLLSLNREEKRTLKKWQGSSLEKLKYRSQYQILLQQKRIQCEENIQLQEKQLNKSQKDYEEAHRNFQLLRDYKKKKEKKYFILKKRADINVLDGFSLKNQVEIEEAT